jgi:hypothetical protein
MAQLHHHQQHQLSTPPAASKLQQYKNGMRSSNTVEHLTYYQKADLRCCIAAWEAGAKLLRVHAADLAGCCNLLRGLTGQGDHIPQPAIIAAQAQGVAASSTTLQHYSKFIVLSAGFAAVRWRVPGDGPGAPYKFVCYTEELLAGLGGGAVEIPLFDGAKGYVLFEEKPKQEPSRVLLGN